MNRIVKATVAGGIVYAAYHYGFNAGWKGGQRAAADRLQPHLDAVKETIDRQGETLRRASEVSERIRTITADAAPLMTDALVRVGSVPEGTDFALAQRWLVDRDPQEPFDAWRARVGA